MEGIKTRQITAILTGLTVLFLASYVYFASTLTSLGYAIDGREEKSAFLLERENELTLELARLQNPERLKKTGEALNMVELDGVSRYIDARTSGLGRLTP